MTCIENEIFDYQLKRGWYNCAMSNSREFRPEISSRRGEATAWVLAIALGAVLFVAIQSFGSLAWFIWFFEGFLVFSALVISLGNWVDRRSLIRIDDQGIALENGLRSVRLTWDDIQNVAVVNARAGKRIQVIGPTSHFTFKLLAESNLFGQNMRTGFADGQFILNTLLKKCGLRLTNESQGMYYYARA